MLTAQPSCISVH